MNAYDTLPGGVTEIFGAEATAEEAYGLLTVDVPAASWIAALTIARDQLGCTYFDWLSAVDEPAAGFRVCAHVVSLEGQRVRRLLLRTTVPHEAPVLASAVDVYAGAAWHERETHEMFGVGFENHPHLVPLLLPENFEGHPLRKDFVLAARVVKAWPGAKEPGESEHGGPKRRQMLPPGVPDPNEWGPQKGQLPPAPARPARTPRAAAGAGAGERPARAAGDRPVRRARSVSEGSASQTAANAAEAAGTAEAAGAAGAAEAPAVRPRRTRSASEGSASQAATPTPTSSEVSPTTSEAASTAPAAPATPAAPETGGATETAGAPEGSEASEGAVRPRRTRSASEGSASQQADAGEGQPAKPPAPPRTRSTDAPWHNPKPAFAEGERELAPPPEAAPAPEPDPGSAPTAVPEAAPEAEPSEPGPAPAPGTEAPDESDPAEPTDPAGGDPRE
ncbi:NADH-quinone oxidoreductase subunit C [Streptomyces sp. NPDC052811]|uniref:NADH-quinone oxidoreductase subunit C n=1 Tax=Streptomyces sp. NPDC052811 TaxID=3155731 RepID=UPI003426ECE2